MPNRRLLAGQAWYRGADSVPALIDQFGGTQAVYFAKTCALPSLVPNEQHADDAQVSAAHR
jgi:hypothetical protein